VRIPGFAIPSLGGRGVERLSLLTCILYVLDIAPLYRRSVLKLTHNSSLDACNRNQNKHVRYYQAKNGREKGLRLSAHEADCKVNTKSFIETFPVFSTSATNKATSSGLQTITDIETKVYCDFPPWSTQRPRQACRQAQVDAGSAVQQRRV